MRTHKFTMRQSGFKMCTVNIPIHLSEQEYKELYFKAKEEGISIVQYLTNKSYNINFFESED